MLSRCTNKQDYFNKKPSPTKLGFTLAEVLITLGIIGIVAAITISTLLSNAQDSQYKSAYRTAYSTANQAWQNAIADDKIVENVTGSDGPAKVANFAAFETYFKVIKDCSSSNNSDCWASGEKIYGGVPVSSANAFIDATGRAWSIVSNSAGSGDTMLVDTNGNKGPNKYGQDRFILEPKPSNSNIAVEAGLPTRITPTTDCVGTASVDCGGRADYTTVCPSVATHPCYFTTWVMQ